MLIKGDQELQRMVQEAQELKGIKSYQRMGYKRNVNQRGPGSTKEHPFTNLKEVKMLLHILPGMMPSFLISALPVHSTLLSSNHPL